VITTLQSGERPGGVEPIWSASAADDAIGPFTPCFGANNVCSEGMVEHA
jgi:hypothetical protein